VEPLSVCGAALRRASQDWNSYSLLFESLEDELRNA